MLFVMEVDAGKFFLKYLRAKPGLLLPLGQLTKGPYLFHTRPCIFETMNERLVRLLFAYREMLVNK